MIIEKKAFEIQALNKDFDIVGGVNAKVDYLCSHIISNYTSLHGKLHEDAEKATKATGVKYNQEDMVVNPYNLLDMGHFSKDIKINSKNISYQETRSLAKCLDIFISFEKDYPETLEFKELLKENKPSSILCDLNFNIEYTICRIGNKEYDFIEIIEER